MKLNRRHNDSANTQGEGVEEVTGVGEEVGVRAEASVETGVGAGSGSRSGRHSDSC